MKGDAAERREKATAESGNQRLSLIHSGRKQNVLPEQTGSNIQVMLASKR